ncbi:energy transducer TonB [Sphingomonas sp.]|uniref:energy transducer TonB n=1 Tax=Sphingomonas sp. TaxID=28214 RepID=UPI00286AF78D|nr:energy transducer TonB [Sphingomonas sp.]
MLSSAFAGGPASTEQVVRQSTNGEFLADHYPPRALKRGEQGKVGFKLTIEPDGSLGKCDVTESSGFASLDTETCEVMVAYAHLKPVRDSEGRAVRAVQPGFIVWKLPAGVTTVASTNAKKMPKPDGLVCKRTQTTGSLIARTTQCLTRTEWAQQERVTRDEVGRMQGVGFCDRGGGPCLPPCPTPGASC